MLIQTEQWEWIKMAIWSALSPEAHAKWGLHKIREFIGLHVRPPLEDSRNRTKLRKDIQEYHIAYGNSYDADLLCTLMSRRPDGLAFDKENKLCVFPEYTRAMDTFEDWSTKKQAEKDEWYSTHLDFINHLCKREKNGWKVTQTVINFTVGMDESISFETPLKNSQLSFSLWIRTD